MFGFLKEKLKNAISSFKKTLEGDTKAEKPKEEARDEKPKKKELETKPAEQSKQPQKSTVSEKEKPKHDIKTGKAEKKETKAKKDTEKPEPAKLPKPEIKEEKKSFFEKIKESFTGKKKEEPKEEGKPKEKAEVQEEKMQAEKKKPELAVHIVPAKKKTEEKPAHKIDDQKTEQQHEAKKEPEQEQKKEPEEKIIKDGKKEQEEQQIEEKKEQRKEEKKGFFEKFTEAITTKPLSEEKFDEIFWDLEVGLLESNVAVEVLEKIKQDLRSKLVNAKIKFGQTEQIIAKSLEDSIKDLFNVEPIDLLHEAKEHRIKKKDGTRPLVVCFFGVNGSGKTTTIAKLCHLLQKNHISCVIAAADTFRAAAIHQLEEHAKKLDVKVIKHDYGADPAAVAFDAIEHAKSKGKDVVLIDTAGRQHSNVNLVDEMKKIIRVANPDIKIFVGDSLTGNDVVEQSKSFDEAVGIDAIILTKADVDEKGGAALSVSYVTGKPIIYIGMGQEYDDLRPFDKDIIMQSLNLEA